MGLGKTIMAMSLILMGKEAPTEDRENWYTAENKKLVHSKATLVVCPVGCLGQWESELRTRARGLRVLMFHGSSRTKSPSLLSQNDVVLTTYSTLCKF
jgi:SNF2 family DNA or RNA helicase